MLQLTRMPIKHNATWVSHSRSLATLTTMMMKILFSNLTVTLAIDRRYVAHWDQSYTGSANYNLQLFAHLTLSLDISGMKVTYCIFLCSKLSALHHIIALHYFSERSVMLRWWFTIVEFFLVFNINCTLWCWGSDTANRSLRCIQGMHQSCIVWSIVKEPCCCCLMHVVAAAAAAVAADFEIRCTAAADHMLPPPLRTAPSSSLKSNDASNRFSCYH